MQDQVHDQPTGRRPLVLFDGGCPMCRREIAHYMRLRGAQQIEWVDIAAAATDLAALGVDRAEAMARFHVRDRSGRWQTGAHAFVELWSHLPGYAVLARGLRSVRLVGLLERAYQPFARWRLARRCTEQSCAAPAAKTRTDND
jgi:predicted DCC family thiol-disulfide oxidoreductase YuxK